jgi:XTP/dITP diphosphohydrolase
VSPPVTLVVATFNRDKLRELGELIHAPDVRLRAVAEFEGAVAPEETGATLAENARIKARAAFARTGLPSVADDTGLEVDALGGEPGVNAARYAGPDATYEDNVRKLLAALEGVPAAHRTARFRCVCVACLPGGAEIEAEGVLEGRITTTRRGAEGFGYDPVFEVEDGTRTLAELTAGEKNQRSHRARAVRALMEKLRPLLR